MQSTPGAGSRQTVPDTFFRQCLICSTALFMIVVAVRLTQLTRDRITGQIALNSLVLLYCGAA
jgi:hypothetical protein